MNSVPVMAPEMESLMIVLRVPELFRSPPTRARVFLGSNTAGSGVGEGGMRSTVSGSRFGIGRLMLCGSGVSVTEYSIVP